MVRRPRRTVDQLEEAVVVALRRGSASDAHDEQDPELVHKLEDMLRHLQREPVRPVRRQLVPRAG